MNLREARIAALERRLFGPRHVSESYVRESSGLLRLTLRPDYARQFQALDRVLAAVPPEHALARWGTEEAATAAVMAAMRELDRLPSADHEAHLTAALALE